MAQSGRRTESLALLGAYLANLPGDADARTLRGTVFSWERRYADARADLETVLATDATHPDALPALARVELWDGHPARSESLAARGLAAHPGDQDLMEIRTLACEALGRTAEALTQVNRLLALAPGRESVRELRRRLIARRPAWLGDFSFRTDRFDDGRRPWTETQIALARQDARGSIGVRASRAERFGQSDGQFEIEAYPRLGARTYAYLSAGVASRATLYPARRFAADLHQPLGAGWEATAGARVLNFSPRVQVYTAAVSKYHGNWLYSARAWLAPLTARRDLTTDLSVRRYRADGESSWTIRYARGQYRDDLQRVDLRRSQSDAMALELTQRLGRALLAGSIRTSREGHAPSALWQTTFTLTTRFRF